MVSMRRKTCHPRPACKHAGLRGDPMIFIIFCFLMAFPSLLRCETNEQRFQGEAKIENLDQVQARKLAIDAGLKNLLIDYLKTHFGDKYSRSEGAIENKILRTPLKYVRKYSVYGGKVEGDRYIISVGGYVHEKLIEEDVALVGGVGDKEARSKVLIMVAEKYVKDPVFRYWWNEGKALSLEVSVSESVFEVHSIFYNALLKSGYDVINIALSVNQNKIPSECQTLELSSSVLAKMAELYGVDYILYGKAFEEVTADKKTKTTIQLFFYSVSLRKNILVVSDSYDIELMQDLINGAADNFIKKLGVSLLKKSFFGKGVLVVVKHKSNFRRFKEVKEALERLSQHLAIQSVKLNEAVFLLKTTKSLRDLKEGLKTDLHPPSVQIHESDDEQRIEIEISNDLT